MREDLATKSLRKPSYFSPEAFDEVLLIEHQAIATRANRDVSGEWSGLALSGGGIRSASFCLGALQALAKAGWLSKIDYLSTVSGGGYIGGGLQWLLNRDAQEVRGGKGFPYGVDSQLRIRARGSQTDLQYLRWHANYLLPGGGLTIFSALAVVFRTAFLSLAIWLPVLTLLFLLIQYLIARPQLTCFLYKLQLPMITLPNQIAPSWAEHVATECNGWLSGQALEKLWPDQPGYISPFYALCVWLALICCGGLALLSLAVAFVSITRFPQKMTRIFLVGSILAGLAGAATLGLGILIVYALVGTTPDIASTGGAVATLTVGLALLLPLINLAGLLVFGDKYKNAEYALRRTFEITGGWLLRVFLYTSILGSLPILAKYAFDSNWFSKLGGALAATSGLISAVTGHFMQSRRLTFGPVGQSLMALFALIFLYGVLLLAFRTNSVLFHPESELYQYQLWFGGAVTMALVFGFLSNSNSIGLHRFYRDRLMELFMPSAESIKKGIATETYAADRLSITQLWKGPATALNLFPIVNCNAILVNDRDPVVARRGGASFAITPLHIGSAVHGWEECESYERKNREMSLATAIAASGAAASANAAYAGSGVTRNRAVSLVLMLLNIRLGVWIRRPSASTWMNLLKPTPFFPTLWYGFLSRGYTSRSAFVEISDGGHFENLGIYELVRRRVELIIAIDGEADPQTAFPALVSLTRRLEEDFGATLDFGAELDFIMPKQPAEPKYPRDAAFSRFPFAKGTITYGDNCTKTSTLIYIKAALIEDMAFSARGYRAQHPDFPNESTSDQFYSPEQFDAYRELGRQCAERAISQHKDSIGRVFEVRA
ncbi:MAG: hypothetical protein QOF41_434 [Methylobacteriaceae bacterium]|nr:hypothetical protein [Methylobacteriaceae bacterium]